MRHVETMGELTANSFPLPNLAHDVAKWREAVANGLGFVVTRGLPVDRWSMTQLEWAFWGLGQHFGEPGAQNTAQDLLGRVTDYADTDGGDQREYRTTLPIDFHCDAADVVGLCCVRPAPQGGDSMLVSSVSVFNRLTESQGEAVETLFEEFTLDSRQDDPSSPPWITVHPCRFDKERLRTFMHLGYFNSADRHDGVRVPDNQRHALQAWSIEANREGLALSMRLQPGDIQWVSNHTVAHARSAYVDDPGAPRELLRLWLSLSE